MFVTLWVVLWILRSARVAWAVRTFTWFVHHPLVLILCFLFLEDGPASRFSRRERG